LGPEKCNKENECKHYTAPYQEINDAHDKCLFLAAKCVARLVNEIIVTVLTGISIAANKGESLPVTA
jgi:hypothetical protein